MADPCIVSSQFSFEVGIWRIGMGCSPCLRNLGLNSDSDYGIVGWKNQVKISQEQNKSLTALLYFKLLNMSIYWKPTQYHFICSKYVLSLVTIYWILLYIKLAICLNNIILALKNVLEIQEIFQSFDTGKTHSIIFCTFFTIKVSWYEKKKWKK